MYTLVNLFINVIVALVIGGVLTYIINSVPSVPATVKQWVVWLVWALVLIWLLLLLVNGGSGGVVLFGRGRLR